MYILLSLFTTQALLQEIVTSKLPTRLHIYTFVFINNTILINFRFKRVKIYPKKKYKKNNKKKKHAKDLKSQFLANWKQSATFSMTLKMHVLQNFWQYVYLHTGFREIWRSEKKKDWRIDTLTDWRLKHCLSRNLLRFGIHTWILMEFIH